MDQLNPPGGGSEVINGGGAPAVLGRSYSDKLKTNVNYNQRLKRNVLEITLERTEKDADLNVGDECKGRVLKSIGVNMRWKVFR